MEELELYRNNDPDNYSKNLIEIDTILKGFNVRFLLFKDAILWAVRGKNIKYKFDIQLALYAEEILHQLQQLICRLQDNGFEILYVNPHVEHLKINIRKRGIKISLAGFYKKGRFRRRYLWKYPARFFDKIEKVVFLENDYWCPSPPEEYLDYQYGDWRNSQKKPPIINPNQRNITSSYLHRLKSKIVFHIIYLPEITIKIIRKVKHNLFPSTREPLFDSMLMCVIKPCVTFIEIGSSDGREICRALNKTKGKMKAFLLEPDNRTLEKIKSKIIKNRYFDNQIQFLNLGVSDSNREDLFYLSAKKSNLNSAIQSSHTNESINIKYVTLDWLIKEMRIEGTIIIKMDIEGYEVEALEGFKNTLSQRREIKIIMEVHPAQYTQEHSLKEKFEFLYQSDFKVSLMETAGVPVPYKFTEKGLTPICIKDTRGLYADVPNDIALDFVSKGHVNIMRYDPWFTRKIVRSILVEKIE